MCFQKGLSQTSRPNCRSSVAPSPCNSPVKRWWWHSTNSVSLSRILPIMSSPEVVLAIWEAAVWLASLTEFSQTVVKCILKHHHFHTHLGLVLHVKSASYNLIGCMRRRLCKVFVLESASVVAYLSCVCSTWAFLNEVVTDMWMWWICI